MPLPRLRAAVPAALVAAAAGVAAAAAPAEAVVVNEDQIVVGKQCVGISCSTTAPPALTFQVHNTDTPVMRLQQASGGYSPYTWDVGGNEANFFIRDVNAGSLLPFRIFPGARGDALTLRGSDVGLGTSGPQAALHVLRHDGDGQLRVENSPVSGARARVLADLVNPGAPLLRFTDTTPDAISWLAGPADGGAFAVRDAQDGAPLALSVTPAGAVTARGPLRESADPALRGDERPVDGAAVLAKLADLPITSWTSAADAGGVRHLGPSGSGFRAAFGVGEDGVIAPGDVAAVALVAARELARGADALRRGGAAPDLAPLLTRVERLERRLAAVKRWNGGRDARAARIGKRVRALERERAAQRRTIDLLRERQRRADERLATVLDRLDALERTR